MIIICARCDRERRHMGRGLCASCYSVAFRQGRIADYPQRGRKSFVAAYRELSNAGFSDLFIAADLGIKPRSLERQLDRHGLPVSAELRTAVRREREGALHDSRISA